MARIVDESGSDSNSIRHSGISLKELHKSAPATVGAGLFSATASSYKGQQRSKPKGFCDVLKVLSQTADRRDAKRILQSMYYTMDRFESVLRHKLNAYAGLTIAEAQSADEPP